MPVWAWALPLLILLLGAGGFGVWAYMASQDKPTPEARATPTARATGTIQAVASATAIDIPFATIVAELDATQTAVSVDGTPTLPAAVIVEAERMPIEEFIALYQDPEKRPIILDVRGRPAYEQGHIAGAVSIPDAETESRLNELPKDRLIVAYCQ